MRTHTHMHVCVHVCVGVCVHVVYMRERTTLQSFLEVEKSNKANGTWSIAFRV